MQEITLIHVTLVAKVLLSVITGTYICKFIKEVSHTPVAHVANVLPGQNFFISSFTNPPTVIFRKVRKK